MKKLTLSILAFCIHCAAQAEEFHSDAPVIAAKLYTQEAELTREVKIHVDEAGQHRIIINPLLSNNINDISPQISGAKLIAQGTQALFKNAEDEEPIWKKFDQAEQAFQLAQQALEENNQLADGLVKRLADSSSDVTEIEEALARLQERRQTLLATKESREKALNALKAELQWLGKQRENIAQMAFFDIQTEQAGEVVLTFREKTSRASWQPYSEFHLHTDTKRISWLAGAQIMQNTGLDWQNVSLNLAITPLNYLKRPELQTTTVAVADKIVSKEVTEKMVSARQQLKSLPAPMSLYAAESAADSAPKIIPNGVDFNVKLSGNYSFPSGGNRYQIPYLEESAPAEIYSGVYTWEQPEALLVGEWTQGEGAGFIPGETSIYRDNNRLTALYFSDIWSGGAKHILSFGKDPQIEVDYHTPPGYTAGSGIIIKDKILEKRENIHVKNLAAAEKNIRIYSRIPVATQHEVSVEGKFSPTPTKSNVEDIKGIYLWEKVLPVGESFNVESGYDIRYPEGKMLIGLD